jgi:hypothetical protein
MSGEPCTVLTEKTRDFRFLDRQPGAARSNLRTSRDRAGLKHNQKQNVSIHAGAFKQ